MAAAADPCKDNTPSSAFLLHVGHSHIWEKLQGKQIPSGTSLIPACPVKGERIFRIQNPVYSLLVMFPHVGSEPKLIKGSGNLPIPFYSLPLAPVQAFIQSLLERTMQISDGSSTIRVFVPPCLISQTFSTMSTCPQLLLPFRSQK